MDFKLSEEHEMFKRSIRQFADKELLPLVEEYDEREEYPVEIFKKLGELGYLNITLPEKYGGAGFDSYALCIWGEELNRIDSGIASGPSSHAIVSSAIYEFGTEEQKQKYLIPATKGDLIFALGITEPGCGSDVAAIQTKAVPDGDDYIINGSKTFITNGSICDCVALAVTVDRTKRHKGIRFVLVDKGTPGFSVGNKIKKMGVHISDTVELLFEDCRVPKANVIGSDDEKNFSRIMKTLEFERVIVAARCVGLAKAAFEYALKYSKERTAFGKPIGKFQITQYKISEMATKIEAARLLTFYAAWKKEEGLNFTMEASMAKLYASEISVEVAGEAVQILGGYGYAREYPVERYFRNSKVMTIGGGTSEIHHLIIAKELGM